MSVLSTNSFAESFSATQLAAARPTFELQFHLLQNSLLDQLTVKVEDLQEDANVNKVDAFLFLEQKKLGRALDTVGSFGNETQHNKDVVGELVDKLTALTTANTNSDESGFNSALADINDLMMNSLKDVNGTAAGLNVKDGLYTYKENGSGLSSFSDYADSSTRSDAIAELQSALSSSLSILDINLNTAFKIHSDVQGKLSSISIQINADALAAQTESIDEIEQLRTEHANFLKYLSIAFEVSQNNAQQLADSLNGNGGQKGTVVDIIS